MAVQSQPHLHVKVYCIGMLLIALRDVRNAEVFGIAIGSGPFVVDIVAILQHLVSAGNTYSTYDTFRIKEVHAEKKEGQARLMSIRNTTVSASHNLCTGSKVCLSSWFRGASPHHVDRLHH